MSEDEPLLELLRALQALGYQFTTVTPSTHARVLSRQVSGDLSLRDIFGWSRPFAPADLDARLLALLQAGDAVEDHDGALRSKVRVASLDGTLFLHSRFPTDEADSVFFGPDTYRFVRFIRERLSAVATPRRVIDMGAGSGAGGIVVARSWPASDVTLVDLNPEALRLAAINAAHAGVDVACVAADCVLPGADLLIANPPYLMDPAQRAYRDGGDLLGGAVARDWVSQALEAMAPGGTILLYTGVAYDVGNAPLVGALASACLKAGAKLEIEELDPDVFGEELESPAYARVERIAVIGAEITLST